jgi:hypothetical protein
VVHRPDTASERRCPGIINKVYSLNYRLKGDCDYFEYKSIISLIDFWSRSVNTNEGYVQGLKSDQTTD